MELLGKAMPLRLLPLRWAPSVRRAPAPAIAHDRPVAGRALPSASDELLAREVQLGNDAAFQIIYERHSARLRRLCRRMMRSPEDAEDALQESLASAWSSMRAAEGDLPRQMRPWLYAVAQNRCLSMLRERGHNTAVLDDPSAAIADDDRFESRSELHSVLADVRDLPALQREALVLSELGGLSHAEVADRLGRQRCKVKSLVFEARTTLTVWREARDIPCDEIREQLSVLRGGALRRRVLRRHLQLCESCRTYRATEREHPRPGAARTR
jgi:RNA polymerase sigma factor (sigma-70 family)